MATYNPRAGMPPRKKYSFNHKRKAVEKVVYWSGCEAPLTVEWSGDQDVRSLAKEVSDIASDPRFVGWLKEMGKDLLQAVEEDNRPDIDSNALRGWLLGYMDSIGDQLPDLAQWRRIREEVGRSVAVKETVKDTSVPVKKVEPKPDPLPDDLERWWRMALLDDSAYRVAIERTTGLNEISDILRGTSKNPCGK